jgi:hypothetical protein
VSPFGQGVTSSVEKGSAVSFAVADGPAVLVAVAVEVGSRLAARVDAVALDEILRLGGALEALPPQPATAPTATSAPSAATLCMLPRTSQDIAVTS